MASFGLILVGVLLLGIAIKGITYRTHSQDYPGASFRHFLEVQEYIRFAPVRYFRLYGFDGNARALLGGLACIVVGAVLGQNLEVWGAVDDPGTRSEPVSFRPPEIVSRLDEPTRRRIFEEIFECPIQLRRYGAGDELEYTDGTAECFDQLRGGTTWITATRSGGSFKKGWTGGGLADRLRPDDSQSTISRARPAAAAGPVGQFGTPDHR